MKNDEFDFDAEFTSDEEVEQMLDSLVGAVAEQAKIEDEKIAFINPYRVRQVLYTYKVLKYLAKDNKGVKVDYELHEPHKSTGYVSVIGKNLTFREPEWFMKAVELASNFDVYTRTDGTVEMDFTFHGLTNPIDY